MEYTTNYVIDLYTLTVPRSGEKLLKIYDQCSL
jgi:hypothetical protein